MGTTPSKRGARYTYADYSTWPDDERWELIGGKAYSLMPAPPVMHQLVLGNLLCKFVPFFRGKACSVWIAPIDVVLDCENVVQPDLLVVCEKNKLTDANVQGAPDLIIEVLSPSTCLKDKREKKALYERFGVREYLLVHPEYAIVDRFVLAEGKYQRSDIVNWDEKLRMATFPELELSLWEIFEREIEETV